MTPAAQNTGGTPATTLIANVRHFLSQRLISRAANGFGMEEVFLQSKNWAGYDVAFAKWHDSYWKWVEQATPAQMANKLRGLQIDWSKLHGFDWTRVPGSDEDKRRWLLEQSRQEMLEQYALFDVAIRGPEAGDPDTYNLFLDDIRVARQIGSDAYVKALAKQKQRKPSKDRGDRRLKPQLLLCWIPCCLWAFVTDGVAEFLNRRFPRSSHKLYDNKSISDARRDLKLYRTPKPLWWGVSGTPPRLQPV